MTFHRTTHNWKRCETTNEFVKDMQYWHWYDCAHCGDHWEMWSMKQLKETRIIVPVAEKGMKSNAY